MMKRVLHVFLCVTLSAAFVVPSAAQQARMPSVEEIIKKLTQPQITEKDLMNDAVSVEGRRARVEESRSIDLAVNFEYASAILTPDARIVLDNLGHALNDPALSPSRIRVAGHTDARGSDAYNLLLSRKRARSVADYLVRQHHIDLQRLTVDGFGRSQLLDPANPASAVNRRVQITNLGS